MKNVAFIFLVLVASTAIAGERFVETNVVGCEVHETRVYHHRGINKDTNKVVDFPEGQDVTDECEISPMLFVDEVSGSYFFVETDGRHISAFSRDGGFLWRRDPFVDSHLESYRQTKPLIIKIGRYSSNDVIIIYFTSSQFGDLDEETGDFQHRGQN